MRKSDKSKLNSVIAEVMFMPSDLQMQTKAIFWDKFPMSSLSLDTITAADAARICGDNRVATWWSTYGFKEWFLNDNEFRQKLDYLASLSLDTMEDILKDPDANANAKASMIKIIFEAGSKFPQKWQKTAYLDESIQKMDKAQLESFLAQQALEASKKEPKDGK